MSPFLSTLYPSLSEEEVIPDLAEALASTPSLNSVLDSAFNVLTLMETTSSTLILCSVLLSSLMVV
ncbi:hypothetical protein D9M68_734230 [compost metagenome]